MGKLTKIFGIALTTLSLNVLADIEVEKVESFDVGDKAKLSLVNVNGDVTLRQGGDNEIRVEAKITAENQSTMDRIDVQMSQDADTVLVKTKYKKSFGYNSGSSEVAYTVWLPEGSEVTDTNLVNGNLIISVPISNLSAKLVNGNVSTQSLSKNVKLSTVNGDMELSMSDTSDSDSIKLSTVNGRISLAVPTNADIAFSAETTHGNISNDFGLPVTKGRYVGAYLKGNLGSGTATANISSVNGAISIKQN